ncbi:DUF3732 domain-containing protein [Mucilaginibacter sp. CAU 1740]|uniref:DUF3732 domain-containing protein n=1 Tax=Mucilaginibacter sp. CAU 1740 TaxID=3140365 RepID=UPI00325AE6A6
MINTNNLHSADGSILGFLYQIERALVWLSSSDIETFVGVEVDDDITVKLIDGDDITNIYEQAKHSQTSRIPYSDRSVDLWKTLSIWVEAAVSATILAFHEFFLSKPKHPTPNFIFLDQPTQVYFPETDVEISDKSEDVLRVRRIFEVLNEAVKRTQSRLQIIILEHVGDYAWTGFENIIKVKRWRDDEPDENDRALIPNSWFD